MAGVEASAGLVGAVGGGVGGWTRRERNAQSLGGGKALWPALVAPVIGCLLAGAIVMAAPASPLAQPLPLLAASLAGTVGLMGVLLAPSVVFPGFVLACMTVPMALEETSIPLGFMKVYGQDLVFAYCVGLLLLRASLGRVHLPALRFNRLILLHVAVGVWAVGVGFKVTGNEFDNVFGDFRRSFFYFLNYFVAILLVRSPEAVRWLRRVFTLGGVVIVAKGAAQVLGGGFYTRRFGDSAHILSHYELTFLSFAVFLAVAEVVFGAGRHRLWWGALAVAGVATTLVGNYRAAWLSLIGGLVFIFLFLPRRGKVALVALGGGLALAAGLAVVVLWDMPVEGYSTFGQDLAAKADVRNTTMDVNVTWRFESYKNALGLWERSPWIGRGLGEELEFSAPTSTGGAMLARGHRVHNSFIWLLMSLGVFGAAVVGYVQLVYGATLVRYLRGRGASVEGRITVMACGAFWVSFLISTAFEIFLESAIPVTVLATSMALGILVVGGGLEGGWERRKV